MAIKENLNIRNARRPCIPPTADGRLLRKHAVFALEYYSTSSLYEGAAINNARRCMIMRSSLLREEEEQTMLQIWPAEGTSQEAESRKRNQIRNDALLYCNKECYEEYAVDWGKILFVYSTSPHCV